MGTEWRELAIGDIAHVVGGGTPSTKEEANFNGDIPWITPRDLAGYPYRSILRGERNISEQGLRNSSAKLIPQDSVLLTTRAPVGYVAIAGVPVSTNQGFRSLVPRDGFSSEFIYYLLKANTEYLKNYASGTTFGELAGTTLQRLRFRFPPLQEQCAIAHILGTLDDKIELNRRMNQTLEAMAQALFKSWFVDFEPFRDQGMQASPMGQIPVEWEVVALGDVATIHDSQRIPLSSRERARRRGIYPYYGATSIMDHIDDYIFDGIYVLMAEDGSVADDNDHPVVQYVWGRFWVNNHAHALQGSNCVSTEHLLLFLYQVNIHPYVTGAVQLKLNQENMRRIPFVLPPPAVCSWFEQRISPLYSSFRVNTEQMNTLVAIRDALLPKLLSGEIRVKDAEKLLEEKT